MKNDPDLLDTLLTHCSEMLFIAGPDGSLQRTSRPLTKALGLAAGQTPELASLVHTDDRAEFNAAWARLVGGELGDEPAQFDGRLRTEGGFFQRFLLCARRALPEDVIIGSLRPAERRVRRELKEQILQAIVENLSIVVCAVDKDGVFVYQDGKALEAAGLRPGHFIGQNIFDLYGASSAATEGLRGTMGEGKIVHTSDAAHGVHWDTYFLPARDERGGISGAVTVSLNITDQKRAEDELRAKLDLIQKQQQVISSLSTPIIQVWDDVLTMPVVGMVDSSRAAALMDNLLQEVARTRARFAILDITGVEAMDTATASHLLRLARALRLIGAEAIITGIQPAIAQTMVGLGVELATITTLGSLRDALRFCMTRQAASKHEHQSDRI
jgi:rsbT co-antagonist protein RsbR